MRKEIEEFAEEMRSKIRARKHETKTMASLLSVVVLKC